MASGYHNDTDSDDDLPPGWDLRIKEDGKVFFLNHIDKTTQWTHPVTGRRKVVPESLPYGWISKQEGDDVVFIETFSGKQTKTDPRYAFVRTAKRSVYDLHQNFDASSTASAVLHGLDMSHKKALITGANSGIAISHGGTTKRLVERLSGWSADCEIAGNSAHFNLRYETARMLVRHGCCVILACRDERKASEAIAKINGEVSSRGECHFVKCDLTSLQSVKDCANEVSLRFNDLDLLILNAATFGDSFGLTEDNYERTFQVNHLAHFYLTLLLKPILTRKPTNRILVLASESHRFSLLTKDNIARDYLSPRTSKNFTSFMAYNDSKLCNVLMAAEISRRWSIRGVTCNSVHPGNMVYTNLSRNWWLYRLLFALVRPFTKSMEQAAATTLWGATAPELKGVSGQYLNNCWICKPSIAAEDTELAWRLWSISVTMIEDVMGPIPTLSSRLDLTEEEKEEGKPSEVNAGDPPGIPENLDEDNKGKPALESETVENEAV